MLLRLGQIGLVVLMSLTAAAPGQSLSERIADYRQRQRAGEQETQAAAPGFVPVPARLAAVVLDPVDLDAVPLRQAVRWFTQVTNIPLVVQWEKLENEGVDLEAPITVQLRHVPAERLLNLMAQQASSELTPLLVDVTPWYAELLTRRQANARVIVRIYPVQDLVMDVPRITDAPRLDLSSALSSSAAGGSRGGGNTLFSEQSEQDRRAGKQERGEKIAQLIRDTIEPDIWIENGGEYSSIRYSDGKLIVRAPRYVHRQIGGPALGVNARPAAASNAATATAPALSGTDASGKATAVSSVRDKESHKVSGTQP